MAQPLSALPTGSAAVVATMAAGVPSMTRLREMGLLPGTRLQLVRRAPLGDPIEISFRGSLLSLRKAEADQIEVDPA